MKWRLLGTSLPIDDPQSKKLAFGPVWPPKQAFFGPKTTRKQTCYHDNQATVFRKLHFFFSIPIKCWQKNYAGRKINHWRCENGQKIFGQFLEKLVFFCIVPPFKGSVGADKTWMAADFNSSSVNSAIEEAEMCMLLPLQVGLRWYSMGRRLRLFTASSFWWQLLQWKVEILSFCHIQLAKQ